jgi:hypothetical protein
MKLELKLVSLMLSLGLFSLPVQSQTCPAGSHWCGSSCCIDACDCSQKVIRLKGGSEFIYVLPAGTSYYCENGQSPKSSASGTEGTSYFVCSSENLGRNAKPRKPTDFTPQADFIYSLEEDIAIQCKTGETPIQKGNVWSCPSKASK